MVIRADDVGYSEVYNIGTFEALEQGVATAADVMYDSPGTVDALERLRELPWISVGWHPHFWGMPVSDPARIPSMYDPARGHFRRDIATAQDVSYEECLLEMRAQMDMGMRILGRTPDTCSFSMGGTPFGDAIIQIADEYGMKRDFFYEQKMDLQNPMKEIVFTPPRDPQWADRRIYMMFMGLGEGSVLKANLSDSLAEQMKYDPIKLWTEDEAGFSAVPDDAVACTFLHPGYVDYYVCREGDISTFAQRFLSIRAVDAHTLCSQELHQWLAEHRIELCNFRDALFGTKQYQNHLRAVGSDLFMG